MLAVGCEKAVDINLGALGLVISVLGRVMWAGTVGGANMSYAPDVKQHGHDPGLTGNSDWFDGWQG